MKSKLFAAAAALALSAVVAAPASAKLKRITIGSNPAGSVYFLLADGFAEVEIEGETIRLDSEDIEIAVEAAEHFAAAGDSAAVVVLNTEIDQKLLDEGLFREILRRKLGFAR